MSFETLASLITHLYFFSVTYWNFKEKSFILPQKTRQPHEILHEGMYTYYPTILSAYFIAAFKHKSQTKNTPDTKLKALVR